MEPVRTLIRTAAAGMLLSAATLQAQAPQSDIAVRDTLQAAVKIGERRVQEALPGTFRTDMKSLRGKVLSPIGENDPIKYAMTRPGVSAGAEGFSAFFARGGNLGNNLFTLDGVRIYGMSHLLGLTTVVPEGAIEAMDFCVGGFDGEHGGLTASHVALHSPDLLQRSLGGEASASNTFLGATVTAPIVPDKAAAMVSARWSPFGLEYGLLKNGFDRNGHMPSLRLGVWDLYAKAQWQVAPRHELSFSGFGSRDDYVLGFPSADYTLGWNNVMGQLSYRFTLPATLLRADISYNRFTSRMEHAATVRGEESFLQLQSKIAEQRYAVTAEHRFLADRLILSEGLQFQRSRMSPGASKMSESAITIVEDAPFTENISHPTLTALFVQLDGRLGPVSLMADVRKDFFNNHAERAQERYRGSAWEFSARAKWQIFEKLALEATYDDRTQFDHTLEGTPLGWSLDLMVPATGRLLPERARQGYGGIFASVAGQAVTLGGYYKQMDNLVYYTDAMAIFTSAATGWNDDARVGTGTSYGLEFLYEGHLPSVGAQWNLAYTWSKTDRRFPDIEKGSPFPARYDRRHILNAGASWKGISLAFTMQSGHWETIAAGQYLGYLPDGTTLLIDYFSHPDNWQMPLYLRLDAGYRLDFKTRRDSALPISHSITLGVFNVLNRHNPSMLTYDADTRTWNLVSLFPIMPSIKYTIEL